MILEHSERVNYKHLAWLNKLIIGDIKSKGKILESYWVCSGTIQKVFLVCTIPKGKIYKTNRKIFSQVAWLGKFNFPALAKNTLKTNRSHTLQKVTVELYTSYGYRKEGEAGSQPFSIH